MERYRLRYADAMHWFWRATIALLAALVAGGGLSFLILAVPWPAGHRMTFLSWAFWGNGILKLALAMTVYGMLTRRYYQRSYFERETRCRQCGYILRGITEPRCPECGERI